MLLLTDRPQEALRFQAIFAKVHPCDVVALDDATSVAAGHTFIVCHANLEDRHSRDLLDTALAHHRSAIETPVLFLVCEAMASTATEMGATEVVPQDASVDHLLFTMRRAHRRQKAQEKAAPLKVHHGIKNTGAALSHIMREAARGATVPVNVLNRGADALLASVKETDIKNWLAIVRRYDDATFQHSMLVAGLVAAFAVRLGLTTPVQHLLARAALVHDIGKARIPIAILQKPTRLTDEEMTIMRSHAVVGHELLARQGNLDPLLLDIVRHHHEYVDGTGYPDRLSGARISGFVRMVTICDIYGALSERRPYKPPLPPNEARALLIAMGGKLDDGLLNAFDAIIRAS